MELICIVCPLGCHLLVERGSSGAITVTGHSCPRGAGFAQGELTHPMRSLTTTVATTLPLTPVLPVRTDGEIPKEKIAEVMRVCGNFLLTYAVRCGDTIIVNAAATGCNIIATRTVAGRSCVCGDAPTERRS